MIRNISQKLVVVILVIFTFLTHISCNDFTTRITTNIPIVDTISVPPLIIANQEVESPAVIVKTNTDEILQADGIGVDQIEHIKLIEFNLTLLTPENEDLSFLQSIEVFMSAPNLEKISIASKAIVPNDVGSTLLLDTSDEDFTNYLNNEFLEVSIKLLNDETTSFISEIKYDCVFRVTAVVNI